MKAFHSKQEIKDKYLSRVRAHREADEIIKGTYWENGKGCAIGCTIHSDNHNAYESELGIPEWLAQLEDTIFEGLPNGISKKWPERFLSAINTGVELNDIKTPFLIYVLNHSLESVRSCKYDAEKFPEVKKSLDECIAAVEEMIRCHENNLDLSAAESAARSAAGSAASSAWSAASSAESAAESAARSAAWSAASSAESAWSVAWSAARSAAWSAARSAARSATYEKYADKLIELIESLK